MRQFTEEEAKAYDEAIEKINSKRHYKNQPCFIDVSEIFPELKENYESERIRKAIIDIIKSQKEQQCHIDSTIYDEMIAWLEKQGNNTPTIIWHNIDEKPKEMEELFCEWESDDATWHDVAFYDEESHTFRHDKMPINVTKWVYVDELLEKQGEQKPAWSEEDERICRAIVCDIANHKSICKFEISKSICDEQINWLKSLKERIK